MLTRDQFLDLAEVSYQSMTTGGSKPGSNRVGPTFSSTPGDTKCRWRTVHTNRPVAALVQDGEYYDATGRRGARGFAFDVDWSESRVTLMDADGLPIARRYTR